MIDRFYLAWNKQSMAEFARSPMRAKVAFALVPADLGGFVGFKSFAVISETGRPLERVYASQYDLLALRSAETPEGREDPAESLIVQNLTRKAQAVGFVVPEVVTTKVKPEWSRMLNPSRATLFAMRRLLGL